LGGYHQSGVYEKLFKVMNRELEKHNIIVKKGILVDASITDSPLKPEAAWIKMASKLR
jgi:IS5 family transposase